MSKPRRINSLSDVQKLIHPQRWKTYCEPVPEWGRVRIITTYTIGERKYARSECVLVSELRVLSNNGIFVYASHMQDKLLYELFYSGVLSHGEQ